jgi:hypothetical protein
MFVWQKAILEKSPCATNFFFWQVLGSNLKYLCGLSLYQLSLYVEIAIGRSSGQNNIILSFVMEDV